MNRCQLNIILDSSIRDQLKNVAENTGTTQRLLVVRLIKDHLHQVRQGVQEPERDLVRDIVDTVEKARGINTSVTLERPCQLNIKLDEAMRDQLKFAAEQAGTSQRQLVAKLIREFLVEIQREDPRLLQKPVKIGELVAQ